MTQSSPPELPTIALVGSDAAFLNAIATTLGPARSVSAIVVAESIEQAARRPELDAAAVIVVDLDSKRRDSLTALQGLRDKGNLQPGQQVLVNGASGGVGTFAVQIAKALGAEVTAVCSTRNVEQALTLAADRVVDYTREDFADGTHHYDLVLDIGGNPSLSWLRRALTPRGTAVIVGGEEGGSFSGSMNRQLRGLAWSPFLRQRLTNFVARQRAGDLERLAGLLEAGTLKPAIHGSYPLVEVPEAMRDLVAGKVGGKVAITVSAPGPDQRMR